LLEFIQFNHKSTAFSLKKHVFSGFSHKKALQFPNLKSTYAQREGGDDISAEELLKMVEEDSDF